MVDSNWGAHGIIYKSVFSLKTPPVGGVPILTKRKLLNAKDTEDHKLDMIELMENAHRRAAARKSEL